MEVYEHAWLRDSDIENVLTDDEPVQGRLTVDAEKSEVLFEHGGNSIWLDCTCIEKTNDKQFITAETESGYCMFLLDDLD